MNKEDKEQFKEQPKEKKSMLKSRIESQYTRNSTFGMDIDVNYEEEQD